MFLKIAESSVLIKNLHGISQSIMCRFWINKLKILSSWE